jgi:hypothetical protein
MPMHRLFPYWRMCRCCAQREWGAVVTGTSLPTLQCDVLAIGTDSPFGSTLFIYPYFYIQFVGVGRATGWTAGVRFPAEAKFFFSLQRPDWLWDPPSLLPNGYRSSFPGSKVARSVKLTIRLHLVPMSGMLELYFHSSYIFTAWSLIN